MSWKQQPPSWNQGFRQDITYEQILKEQVKVCLEALNTDDRDASEAAIKNLSALITTKMLDDQYIEDIDSLEIQLQKEIKEKRRIQRKQLIASRGGCPDLIPRISSRPDIEHLTRQFRVILNLLERKKMGLKLEVEETV